MDSLAVLAFDANEAADSQQFSRTIVSGAARAVGLDWTGRAIQIERSDIGPKGLADETRRDTPETCLQVEAAVAGLYNYATQIIPAEWIFFLEDDVIPCRPDPISRLMESVSPGVAAATCLYAHRYHPMNAVAFRLPYVGLPSMLALEGPEVEQIGGSGYGSSRTDIRLQQNRPRLRQLHAAPL